MTKIGKNFLRNGCIIAISSLLIVLISLSYDLCPKLESWSLSELLLVLLIVIVSSSLLAIKNSPFSRKIIRFIFAFIILSLWQTPLAMGYFLTYQNVSNTIFINDAKNPDFEKEAFRYYRYISSPDLYGTLRTMFPSGTSREEVEKILVEKAGAKKEDRGGGFVIYSYPKPMGIPHLLHMNPLGCDNTYRIAVEYDKANQVVSIVPKSWC